MLQSLIEQYRQKRKRDYLALPEKFRQGYAFIGVGSHSIANLYPVLQYLGVNLRYIHSRKEENAKRMAARFPGAAGTADLGVILKDENVKTVFVCSRPEAQMQIVKQCLEAGKHVWTEKPVCRTAAQLRELVSVQEKHNRIACVGVQKRYAPAYNKLRASAAGVQHYTLAYRTGAYPEGDVLTELFIHPLDLSVYLFGRIESHHLQISGSGGEVTMHLNVKHNSGVHGQLEISSMYDWRSAEETLTVNAASGVYRMSSPASLLYTAKPRKVLGIPTEKIFSRPPEQLILFDASKFLPQLEHQPAYVHGYYGELLAFCNAVEGHDKDIRNDLSDLLPVYDWIDQLRTQFR